MPSNDPLHCSCTAYNQYSSVGEFYLARCLMVRRVDGALRLDRLYRCSDDCLLLHPVWSCLQKETPTFPADARTTYQFMLAWHWFKTQRNSGSKVWYFVVARLCHIWVRHSMHSLGVPRMTHRWATVTRSCMMPPVCNGCNVTAWMHFMSLQPSWLRLMLLQTKEYVVLS